MFFEAYPIFTFTHMASDSYDLAKRALNEMLKQRSSNLPSSVANLIDIEKQIYGDKVNPDGVRRASTPRASPSLCDPSKPLPTVWKKGDKSIKNFDVECRYLNPRKKFEPQEKTNTTKKKVQVVPKCAYSNIEKANNAREALRKLQKGNEKGASRTPFK